MRQSAGFLGSALFVLTINPHPRRKSSNYCIKPVRHNWYSLSIKTALSPILRLSRCRSLTEALVIAFRCAAFIISFCRLRRTDKAANTKNISGPRSDRANASIAHGGFRRRKKWHQKEMGAAPTNGREPYCAIQPGGSGGMLVQHVCFWTCLCVSACLRVGCTQIRVPTQEGMCPPSSARVVIF